MTGIYDMLLPIEVASNFGVERFLFGGVARNVKVGEVVKGRGEQNNNRIRYTNLSFRFLLLFNHESLYYFTSSGNI